MLEPALYVSLLNLSMGVIVLPVAWRMWKNQGDESRWSLYDSSETFFWSTVFALLATLAWLACGVTYGAQLLLNL